VAIKIIELQQDDITGDSDEVITEDSHAGVFGLGPAQHAAAAATAAAAASAAGTVDAHAAAAAAASAQRRAARANARRAALLEGLLQERVSHPNVVRNFKFLTRPTEAPCRQQSDSDDDGDAAPAGASWRAPAPAAAAFGVEIGAGALDGGDGRRRGHGSRERLRGLEAWLVLEYCGLGSVADAIDAGWFKAGRRLSIGERPGGGGRAAAAGSELNVRAVITTAREIAAGMTYLHSEVRLVHSMRAAASRRAGRRGRRSDAAKGGRSRACGPNVEAKRSWCAGAHV
jgi:serine/threonine protein kinase